MRLRTNSKWRARRAAHAQKALSDIEASIVSLNDEDLLDLHDFFLPNPSSALAIFATNEIHRRKLSPDKPA